MSAEASVAPDAVAALHRLEAGTTTEEALSFFDSPAAGESRGDTRNVAGVGAENRPSPERLLENLGWHGKRSEDADSAPAVGLARPTLRLLQTSRPTARAGIAEEGVLDHRSVTGRVQATAARLGYPCRRPKAPPDFCNETLS
jgi:hypothetical protein